MKNVKTPEDEAFDDLAKQQGAWGGGFQAKRAAAADKMHWSDCAVHNGPAYPAGPCDCGPTQPADNPYGYDWSMLEAAQESLREHMARIKELEAQLSQPAQKHVAWTLLLTGEHHGIIGEAGEKFIGAPECYQRVDVYTTPPKREWVGLTAEDFGAIKFPAEMRFPAEFRAGARWAEVKLKEKNA
jgi:hypothetical protein